METARLLASLQTKSEPWFHLLGNATDMGQGATMFKVLTLISKVGDENITPGRTIIKKTVSQAYKRYCGQLMQEILNIGHNVHIFFHYQIV